MLPVIVISQVVGSGAIAMVDLTPLFSPHGSWQPWEQLVSTAVWHLFILDCYWVTHESMWVLSLEDKNYWCHSGHLPQRVMSLSSPRSHGDWRMRVGLGGSQLGSSPKAGERRFPRCQTDALERNDRLWVGPQIMENSGASQPPSLPWQQLFSLFSFERELCDCWH